MTEETEAAYEIVGPAGLYGSVLAEEPSHLGNAFFGGQCEVGAFTYFSRSCEVGGTVFGRYCSIGQECIIGPGDHPINFVTSHPVGMDASGVTCGMSDWALYHGSVMTALSNPTGYRGQTQIQSDVWLGARVVVAAGVTIGVGSVIGAGSLVTKDIPPFSIAVGSPARVTRTRLPAELVERLLESQWWTRDLSRLAVRDYSDVPGFLAELERVDPPEYRPRTKLFSM